MPRGSGFAVAGVFVALPLPELWHLFYGLD
jgi:hypothetical protein